MRNVSINVRDKVMDELHDSPGSITDVASAIEMSNRVVRDCFNRLEVEGLIEPYMRVPGANGSVNTYYQLTRTKKSTELGPVAV